jgi:putative transcriptional regulator
MNRIAEIRERDQIKQGDLAKALGWQRSRLSNYETERRVPSLADSRSIVAALNQLGAGCNLDQVFPPTEAELIGADRRVAERRTTERRAAERRVTERAA